MNYEAVIGLEVHVQIKTASKMFTRVASGYGQPENTLTDPVVLALPGALPVLNKKALDAIIKTGLMYNCDIASETRWDRKNYFYPDSPKNYQISQQTHPICRNGAIRYDPIDFDYENDSFPSVPLTRIHLEEDVGKLNHGANDSLVDYNRAGTPLMEIVTEPAIHSPDVAFAFLTALRADLQEASISDCDMEKGQMRCDANVSIRPVGETKLGTKVELKNLNSISYVRDGIMAEIKRQIAIVTVGGMIKQETRLYDGENKRSASMRSKEMAHDYRYFPDPDLMPVKIREDWLDELRKQLPAKLPLDRRKEFISTYKMSHTIAATISASPALSGYLVDTVGEFKRTIPDPVHYFPITGIPPPAAPINLIQTTGSWIVNSLVPAFRNQSLEFDPTKFPISGMAQMVHIVAQGTPSNTSKEIFAQAFATGIAPQTIFATSHYRINTDSTEITTWCDTAIANDAKSAEQVKAGNAKAINALKGAVMKLSAGKANPKLVDEILKRKLGV